MVIRDLAVSDGITTLDLWRAIEARGVGARVTGTDLRLAVRYAEAGAGRGVSLSDGSVLQVEIGGVLYGRGHRDLSAAPVRAREGLEKALAGGGTATATMLAPEVEWAAGRTAGGLRFREEDAFDPDEDIGEADVIRVANLLVERTADHRGYYDRADIVAALGRVGEKAKDGAHLYLNDFRKKVEHVGHWRKDGARGAWVREPVGGVAADLAGVRDIAIDGKGG